MLGTSNIPHAGAGDRSRSVGRTPSATPITLPWFSRPESP